MENDRNSSDRELKQNLLCNMLKNITFGIVNFNRYEKQNTVKIYSNLNHTSARVKILPESVISTDKILIKKMEKKVKTFISNLSNKGVDVDLTNFRDNFKTARFNLKNSEVKNGIKGFYTSAQNSIYLYTFSAAYHELMHMASSRSDSEYLYSGFTVLWDKNEKVIGKYFNEGCTQYLTKKYFNVNSNSYEDAVKIAKRIEELIGEKNFEHYYFKADLLGLVTEMEKYTQKKDIVKFLYSVDELQRLGSEYANSHGNEKSNYAREYYETFEEINLFIDKCLDNKDLSQDISKFIA